MSLGSPITDVQLFVGDNCDQYHDWLSESYTVSCETMVSNEFDDFDPDSDVVIVDVEIRDSDPAEFARELSERNLSGYVILVTDPNPDYGVLQQGFDAYVAKPADESKVTNTIETVQQRATFNGYVSEWAKIQTRINVFEGEMSDERRDESAFMKELYEYNVELEDELLTVGERIDDVIIDLDGLGGTED